MSSQEKLRRARGCLLGLACGDALGRPVEGLTRATIERKYGRLTEMVGDGVHGLSAGAITDDTYLTLCTARSLAEKGGFDGEDMLQRFTDWYGDDPVGVGGLTAAAIQAYADDGDWDQVGRLVWEDRPEGENAGNGSIMRIAPIGLAYDRPDRVRGYVSMRASALTHADSRCLVGCHVISAVIAANLTGDVPSVDDLRSTLPQEVPESNQIAVHDLRNADSEDLPTSGYVVDTLQTALYDGLTADSAEEAISRAVNRGGDTDTIGAIAGAIAGARFGEQDLPARWLEKIDEADELRTLADELVQQTHENGTRLREGYTVADPEPDGPTYIPAEPPVGPAGGHRPDYAPYPAIDVDARQATPAEAVEADWIRRAYRRTKRGRPDRYELNDSLPPDPTHPCYPQAVRVPEYFVAATVADLPRKDRLRLESEFERAMDAADLAQESLEAVGSAIAAIESTPTTGQLARLVRTGIWGTTLDGNSAALETDPDWIRGALDDLGEAASATTELCSLLATLPDDEQTRTARDRARSALGHTQAAFDAIRAVVIRHPELNTAFYSPE